MTGDVSRPSFLDDHSKHNSVAEFVDLLKLERQFLIHAEPALNEATDRRSTLEVVSQRPPVKDRIGSKAAHHRINVTAVSSLKLLAHKLNRVGRVGSSVVTRCSYVKTSTVEGASLAEEIMVV